MPRPTHISRGRFAFVLAVELALFSGCGPYEEVGPLPLTGAGKRVVRLREEVGSFSNRRIRTLWDFGEGPIEPMQRIAELEKAIPRELDQKLQDTLKIAKSRPPRTETMHFARGTVVSLDPDVMIVTVRPWQPGDQEMPYDQWNLGPGPANVRGDYLHEHVELIGARDVALVYYSGTLVAWSEEMYAVSNEAAVGSFPIAFDDNTAEISIPHGKLVLTRRGHDVRVRRE